MRARLVSADGGPSIDLLKELTLFGRDEDCDVRLDHKSVSKLHCVIVKTDGVLVWHGRVRIAVDGQDRRQSGAHICQGRNAASDVFAIGK